MLSKRWETLDQFSAFSNLFPHLSPFLRVPNKSTWYHGDSIFHCTLATWASYQIKQFVFNKFLFASCRKYVWNVLKILRINATVWAHLSSLQRKKLLKFETIYFKIYLLLLHFSIFNAIIYFLFNCYINRMMSKLRQLFQKKSTGTLSYVLITQIIL